MITCVCPPAPAPYDHLLESSSKCIAHNWDVRLVAAGWVRNGGVWTHEEKRGLWTKEQAMEALDG